MVARTKASGVQQDRVLVIERVFDAPRELVFQAWTERERLVFTHAWLDSDGQPGHETVITVTFADRNGKTAMTFRQEVFESVAERDGHRGGWNECFDRLRDELQTVPQRSDNP